MRLQHDWQIQNFDPSTARGFRAVVVVCEIVDKNRRVGPREAHLIAHLAHSSFVDRPSEYTTPQPLSDVISIFSDKSATFDYHEMARMVTMLTAAEPELLSGWLGDLTTEAILIEPDADRCQYAMGLIGGYFHAMKWIFDHFHYPPSDTEWMSPYPRLVKLIELAGDVQLVDSLATEYGTWLAPAVKAYIVGPDRGSDRWVYHSHELWKSIASVGDWVTHSASNLANPGRGKVYLGKIVVEQLTCKAIQELGWTEQAYALSSVGHHLTDPLPRRGK